MRISTDRMDQSYKRDLSWALVYLDGKLQKDVITADEEQGFILKYEQNDVGQYMIEGDDILIVKYLGNVVIRGTPGKRADGLYAK